MYSAKKPIFIFTLLILTLLGLVACSTAPKAPDRIIVGDHNYAVEYLTWLIEKEMNDHGITGLSIALVDAQELVWSQGFGYADKENQIKAMPETLYRAASISKTFTAIAAMKLQEQGLINIDEPLKSYLPEFEIKSRFGSIEEITPRSIMTHHSGLPSDWWANSWQKNPAPFTALASSLADEYTAYAPNVIYSYSNIGPTLLGHAIQHVTKKSYSDYLFEEVLNPMGMPSSFFSQHLKGSHAAKNYQNGKLERQLSSVDIPAAGLNSSVLDLARLIMLVNGEGQIKQQRILTKRTMNEMQMPQNADVALDLNLRLGLGWFFMDTAFNRREKVIFHNGGAAFHRSIVAAMPDRKLGVVVMMNSPAPEKTLNTIAEKSLKLLLEVKTGQSFPLEQEEMPVSWHKGDYINDNIAGYYMTSMGFAELVEDSGKLKANIGGTTLHLQPGDNGFYHLQYRLFGVIPIHLGKLSEVGLSFRRIESRDVLVATDRSQEYLSGEKLTQVPIPSAWRHRVGRYVNLNPMPMLEFKSFELNIKGGFLINKISFDDGTTLTNVLVPLNDKEAIRAGLGRGLGETVRSISENGEELLTYAGIVYRKLEPQSFRKTKIRRPTL